MTQDMVNIEMLDYNESIDVDHLTSQSGSEWDMNDERYICSKGSRETTCCQ